MGFNTESRLLVVLVFGLMSLVFASGCVNYGGKIGLFGIVPSGPNYTVSEDIKVSANAYPSDVIEGKESALYFDVSNDGNITISDFDLLFTDLCDFKGGNLEKKFDEIKPGDLEQWNWKIKAKNVDMPETCALRYDVSYKTSSSAYYDIAAVSEAEQERLLREGKMEEISLNYYKTKTPVEIDISMSEEQPIVENSSFYLYIDLRNVGSGYVERIKAGDAVLEYPNFLELKGCDDYDNQGRLKRDLEFYRGQTKKSTCKFRVKEGTVIRDVGTFKLKVNYKYMYHKIINVGIKPD